MNPIQFYRAMLYTHTATLPLSGVCKVRFVKFVQPGSSAQGATIEAPRGWGLRRGYRRPQQGYGMLQFNVPLDTVAYIGHFGDGGPEQ